MKRTRRDIHYEAAVKAMRFVNAVMAWAIVWSLFLLAFEP